MKEKFDLELVPWQSRMVKDFLDLKTHVDVVTIKPGVIKCPASYKIPVEGLTQGDWVLYLTRKQMKIVQKEFELRSPISGINITESQIKSGEVVFHEKMFRLKLAPWQSRMAMDFLDEKNMYREVIIKPGVIQCPASYKIPVMGLSVRDWVLFLTDRQLGMVQKKFGLETPVSGINITQEQIRNKEVVFQ